MTTQQILKPSLPRRWALPLWIVRAAMTTVSALAVTFAGASASAPTPGAATAAEPQGKKGEPVCPYCKNDEKVLEGAGLKGHGKMPFGKNNSDEIKKFLSYTNPLFIESKHFRIGSLLESYTIPESDWKAYAAEFAELRKVLPAVPAKPKILDPWLRLHLYAWRCEKRYERFLKIIQRKEEDFPDKRIFGAPYMGEGRYLGMQDKYEVFLHKDLRTFTDLLREHSGSTTKKTKREHYVERGALGVHIPMTDEVRADLDLYAHLTHNLGHLFHVGYKHYTYEPPKWLEEGFAHVFEKEVNPEYNSFDSEEAATADMYEGDDWYGAVVRVIDRGKAAPLADLVHRSSFSSFGKEDHLIIWSKVEFLMSKPDLMAKLFDTLAGRLNKEGFGDGSNLQGAQREFLKKEAGWTFEEFDREWEKYVRKTYIIKKP